MPKNAHNVRFSGFPKKLPKRTITRPHYLDHTPSPTLDSPTFDPLAKYGYISMSISVS